MRSIGGNCDVTTNGTEGHANRISNVSLMTPSFFPAQNKGIFRHTVHSRDGPPRFVP